MSQRRRYEPDWPDYGGKRKRQLRSVLALLVLIVIGLAARQFAPQGATESGETASRGTAVGSPIGGATATSGKGSTPGVLSIGERETGWYASNTLASRPDATRVEVARVIDGDTLDVLAAQTPLRVRFYGVDTPERNERCYAEATQRTMDLTRDGVILVPDARQQDPGGRELRYVFALDGRSVDATLVAEGLAKAWRDDGALRTRLIAIEERAKRSHTGCLWG